MLASTFAALLLALTTAALPHVVVDKSPISLSLSRHLNSTGSVKSLAEIDRARAQALRLKTGPGPKISKRGVFPVTLTSNAVSYSVDIGVGSPPTTYTLLVDTGSSLTWVGGNKTYVPTNTSIDSGQPVFVEYGSGFLDGEGYFDTVTLGNLTVTHQFIGVAIEDVGPPGLDGILGIGPTDLTEGATPNDQEWPTVTDNAFAQGNLDSDEIGVFFQPTTSDNNSPNGELTFGGPDSTKTTGPITTVPLTTTQPASFYLGINQSITYGTSGMPILNNTAGIVDTGTTLLMIASDAFNRYQNATGATMDSITGLLKLPASQYDSLQSLFFQIGQESFEFTKNAQIWPRQFNTDIGGDDDSVYLIVGDSGSNSGEGLDFTNGYTFLQRFYMVYNSNSTAPSFGIATTSFTTAETN